MSDRLAGDCQQHLLVHSLRLRYQLLHGVHNDHRLTIAAKNQWLNHCAVAQNLHWSLLFSLLYSLAVKLSANCSTDYLMDNFYSLFNTFGAEGLKYASQRSWKPDPCGQDRGS